MKKQSRKAVVKEADKWFSLYIRAHTAREYNKHNRGYGLCPFCEKEEIQHCFHFFTRTNYSTRWAEENAIGSCAGCNFRMEFAPYPFYKWFADHFGQFALDELNRKHHAIAKFSTEDIKDIAVKYKKLYEEIKNV